MTVAVDSVIYGKVPVGPRQITQSEIGAYAKFAKDRGIINDGGVDDQHNADIILNYFLNTWGREITEQNLNLAWEQLRGHLKLYSPAAIEYYKLADQEPDRANLLANWLATQGKAGQLVNTAGDETYANLRLLLIELRGREITRKTISDAEGRIAYKPGRQLHYVPVPKQQDPRQHESDGEPFLGRDVNLTPAQHRERARAAYAEPDKESSSTIRGREQAAAQQEAETMRGNTHSQTEQLKKLFVYDQVHREIDWVATRNARRAMKQSVERRSAVTSR